MCGRARLSSEVSEIKLVFSILTERPTPNVAASWNVAPADPLPIVHLPRQERRAAEDCGGGAALCDRAGRPAPDGAGRSVGDLALAGRKGSAASRS
jgi:hypothetical protein